MKACELVERLKLETLAFPCPEREIEGAYAGDLLSWVMGRAESGCVWATIMTNINVVAVASLADVAACVICENCEITDEIIDTAKSKGVNLFRTTLSLYEFCVELSKII